MSAHLTAQCRWALLAALLAVPLAPARAAESPPRIVFTETSHDFGEIEEGELLTRVFRFRNDGDRVLEAKGG